MTLSRKQNKPLHPPLNMAKLNINEVTSHKHLGLIFSNDGSWHEYIDHVKAKSWFRLNIMRKLKFQLVRKPLEIIYTSFIRPLLEYSNVVWDNCTKYESKNMEKIQNETARIVTGATKLKSLQSLYIETGWKSLASRRQKSKLVLFYKMQNEMIPEYISSLAPLTVGSKTGLRLHNESDLQTIPA